MLNLLWLGLIACGLLTAGYRVLAQGESQVAGELVAAMFASASLAFEVAIGLVGVLCLWLGLLKVAEQAGVVNLLARLLQPLFSRLMPSVPKGDPALGAVTLNLSANMLGLDNAATPLGIKAMQGLQRFNPSPLALSPPQALFLVLNTSSVTLLPITVLLYRAQQGASDPTAVFIPILLATSISTLVGVLAICCWQRIRLLDSVLLGYAALSMMAMATLIYSLQGLTATQLMERSSLWGNGLLLLVVALFLGVASVRRRNAYEAFIQGAQEGFQVALQIPPYLLAMLVAIGMFRASGALDILLAGIRGLVMGWGWDTGFVEALPTALVKPLSGSGARAMMLETMQTYGADSFPAFVASIMQGSTETTLYVLAVYCGAVGVRQAMMPALVCGLLADVAGLTSAIVLGYWFYAG